MNVSILSWNVWFAPTRIRARTEALVREIVRRRPDVVALQEITPPVREVLERILGGYTIHGGDSVFGYDVVIATRVPVVGLDSVELPTEMGRRLLAVELADGLIVSTVHLESTAPYERTRVRQLELIGEWLAMRAPDSVLVGDMNFDDFAARESDALDDSFVDVWPALRDRAREPGYTVANKRRFDRAFVRGPRYRATAIELVGTTPIDDAGHFTSDHFGLALQIETPDTAIGDSVVGRPPDPR